NTIALIAGSALPRSTFSTMPSGTPGLSALTGGLSTVMTPIPSTFSNRTNVFSGMSCPSRFCEFITDKTTAKLGTLASLLVRKYLRYRNPALSGDGVEQVDPTLFLEDGGIAQLVYVTIGGAAHRRCERRIGAFPSIFRAKDFDGSAFLPAMPIAVEADAA